MWNISSKNGGPVERNCTRQLEMEMDGEGGRQGEAFSVYEEDSHSGCSTLYFVPPRRHKATLAAGKLC